MTQKDRDRLVVLKKAQKGLIPQRQAATELDLTERHVRRLLRALKSRGDASVIHGLRGRTSNHKLSQADREKIVQIVAQQYTDFGPTLASEYLAKKHKVLIGREALRQVMISAGLWHPRAQKVEKIHQWRTRRSCRGELVQWDTSEHDWLEGRGEKLYLIAMIDDATSELTARFAPHDSTAENMALLWKYLEKNGRPAAFYTDKASLFQTAPKVPRDVKTLPRDEREPLPPTQIGRALRELGIVWIPAHSPQAKGRIERSFGTAQDRLVKGLRIAGASTLEQTNRYLEQEFLPWWNQHLVLAPANAADAHRPLGADHDLSSALSQVETRQVANDYTIRFEGKTYRIARADVTTGLRGGTVRVERRLDGTLAVRFRERYVAVSVCTQPERAQPQAAQPHASQPAEGDPKKKSTRKSARPPVPEAWRESQSRLLQGNSMPLWAAAALDRTRTRDKLD
jgi:transposase